MKTEFSDRAYQFSHGRAPRGRGSWAFDIDGLKDPATGDNKIFWFFGTLAEAKKQMRDACRLLDTPPNVTIHINILP